MKKFLIISALLQILTFLTACSSVEHHDIIYAYYSKAQKNRPAQKVLFFNDSHSKYKKYRVNPNEKLKENERPVFDIEKLPKNQYPAEDDWMYKLLEALKDKGFFEYGLSADSIEQAKQYFASKDTIKQCLILSVDGNVTVALPPSPLVIKQQSELNEQMQLLKIFVEIYIATSRLYLRPNVKTGGGIMHFKKDIERAHKLAEQEKQAAKEKQRRQH